MMHHHKKSIFLLWIVVILVSVGFLILLSDYEIWGNINLQNEDYGYKLGEVYSAKGEYFVVIRDNAVAEYDYYGLAWVEKGGILRNNYILRGDVNTKVEKMINASEYKDMPQIVNDTLIGTIFYYVDKDGKEVMIVKN